MDDLKQRFGELDGIQVPDLRGRIERGPDHEMPGPPRRRRAPTLIAALGLAAASVFLVVRAFDDVRPPAGRLRENGLIVYSDEGPQPRSIPFDNIDVFALDPATGERVNLTNTSTVAELSPLWSPDGTKVVYERATATGEGSDLRLARALVVADADLSDPVVIRRCSEGCGGFDIAWSPDGFRLAWTAEARVEGGSVIALQVHDLRSGSTTTLCDSRTCGGWPGQPAWSPDGTRIAFSNAGSFRIPGPFVADGPIWVADVSTGQIFSLTRESEPCTHEPGDTCSFDSSPAWSPDGQQVAFVRRSLGTSDARTQWLVIRADESDERELLACASSDQCREDLIAWSPDGASVAFIDRYDHPVLHVIDPTDGSDAPIPLPASAGDYPSSLLWSPDGSQLAFLGGGRQADLFLVEAVRREIRDVASDLSSQGDLAWLPAGAIEVPSAPTPPRATTTSVPANEVPGGSIVFSSSNGSNQEDGGTEIWAIGSDGSGLTRLTDNQHIDVFPALSPDGSRIAFASHRPGDPNTQVYVMNRNGTDQHVLTDRRTGAGQPAWSPDGARIAFGSSDGFGEPGGIFVMNADGSDQRLVAEGNTFDLAWSPDGNRIVYAIDTPDGELHLRIVDLRTGESTELPRLPGSQQAPAWSPDGGTIAFVWTTSAGQAIHTMRLDGSDLRKVAQGSEPVWSPDGSWLAYTHTDDRSGPQIWAVAATGQGARPLTSMRGFVTGTSIYAITGSPSWGQSSG
jgi:Tol biopolymer transport system component